jgi:hypothetical protein
VFRNGATIEYREGVPFVILLVGTPIALGVRGVFEAVNWLVALIFG